MVDDGGLRVFAEHDERVREDGGVFALDPMEELDGQGDFDVLRNVNEHAAGELRLVELRVFVRAELDRLRHDAAARQPVVEGEVARADALADVGRIMLDVRH